MTETRDIVVTCPQWFWPKWLCEGDLPGDPPEEGGTWDFGTGAAMPDIAPGARVYVVAHGLLRGYAPLVELHRNPAGRGGSFIRQGGAVAVTLQPPEAPAPSAIPGFRGPKYRWWPREHEVPFPDFATRGLPKKLEEEVRKLLAARARGPVERAKLRAWALGKTS